MTKQESKLLSEIARELRSTVHKPLPIGKILSSYKSNNYGGEYLFQHLLLWIEKNNKDGQWKS